MTEIELRGRVSTFDAEPCLDSALEDIAVNRFQLDYLPEAVAKQVLEENDRPIEHQLASLRFFDQRFQCPTNAGIILFGRNVRRYLPGAYIQFLRVAGLTLADPVTQDRELLSDLLTILKDVDAILAANILQAPQPETILRETMVASYPQAAIRELLRNSIMHRDYASTAPLRFTWFDDRVEIQSPGGLYGEATAANFPNQTSYRNPVIAEALKALGYVNRYGRGVLRAQEAMSLNGNPPVEFVIDKNYVRAILRRRPSKNDA